jgi:hypothetical protein
MFKILIAPNKTFISFNEGINKNILQKLREKNELGLSDDIQLLTDLENLYSFRFVEVRIYETKG